MTQRRATWVSRCPPLCDVSGLVARDAFGADWMPADLTGHGHRQASSSVTATQFWIMSHQAQLSPAASHAHAVLDPAGTPLSGPAEPISYSPGGQDECRIAPTLQIRSARASCPPPQDSGQAQVPEVGPMRRWSRSRLSLAGRPNSRREESDPRTPRALGAPH